MQLSKQLQDEVLQAYNTCWEAYLKGDLKSHASFLSKDFKIIGTSESEQFNSRKEWIAYCKKTVAQYAGVIQKKNCHIELVPVNKAVMVVENSDIYVLINGQYNFYSKARITALLQKFKTGWKYIHQHGSFPDTKANDGEVIGKEQIEKENLELRDAIKRRTAELEQKNRELEIEAALERVRATAMGMRKADDLLDICKIMFKELQSLGFSALRNTLIHTFVDDQNYFIDYDYSDFTGGKITRIPSSGNPLIERFIKEIRKSRDAFTEIVVTGSELDEWRKFRKAGGQIDDPRLDSASSVYYYYYSIEAGDIGISTFGPITNDETSVLKRFRNVFDFAYRRYTDIEKAEAQAREAQIEAALEKVRSRSLAMHKSDELQEVANTLFERLNELNVKVDSANIVIFEEGKRDFNFWVASNYQKRMESFHIPYSDLLITKDLVAARESGTPFFGKSYSFEEKNEWFNFAFKNTAFQFLSEERKQMILSATAVTISIAFSKHTGIQVTRYSKELLSEEQVEILKKFSKVFEQAYIRFLDLQKAEALAKEAKVEASLERIRSKTMAMHNSEDVTGTVLAMFDELIKLGVETIRSSIAIIHDINKMEVWTAKTNEEGKVGLIVGTLAMNIHPMLVNVYNSWKNGEAQTTYELVGEDLKNYFRAINASPGYHMQYDENTLPYRQMNTVFYFPEGSLFAFSNDRIPEESANILKRFAAVFGQTYRRYLDLQKAEANAREATIEAALEKVRGKAMAMHNSNDLSATTSMVITELRKLGITPIRCGVGIVDKEKQKAQLYTARSTSEGDTLAVVGWAVLKGHPILETIYKKWVAGEDYFPELEGDSLRLYYEQLLAGLSVPLPNFTEGEKHYGHFLSVSVGCLYAWSLVKYNDEEIKILKRFASIIDLTFRRYFELQQSEENAKEAVKQAALDRIRADIASMRTINDLDRITPLIWKELTILGIPFIRCGVFIMDETQQLIHTFLSTPDGKAIAAFHLPYDTTGNVQHVLQNWKEKSRYIDHWDESEFHQFAEILVVQGALDTTDSYLKTIPQGGFYLHFLPFLQGMLYVGNTEELNKEQTDLIQHVADAFSTAYARYEDFNKLEEAKQQVEKTLTNLEQAQQQLIQSEKMASLGELTAGIAHEIQNPLNFVNNFSEVSHELLDEMITELNNRNSDEAKIIANDIKQNLEKINHHGKRADAIVKGMLQHSRISSGQKELTDINVLADEYLRLAYHGLRAKDKSFNATMKTDFDESIGKINIIPQEIGRVILNLITNAFYAVTEKCKQKPNGYRPTVTVSTKRLGFTIVNGAERGDGSKVEIKVSDNGIGISEKLLDKIFQPFFTTKPTGQGTGLGLSLSYDIIKAHGGEIQVKTKEGEGTIFTITLPV